MTHVVTRLPHLTPMRRHQHLPTGLPSPLMGDGSGVGVTYPPITAAFRCVVTTRATTALSCRKQLRIQLRQQLLESWNALARRVLADGSQFLGALEF